MPFQTLGTQRLVKDTNHCPQHAYLCHAYILPENRDNEQETQAECLVCWIVTVLAGKWAGYWGQKYWKAEVAVEMRWWWRAFLKRWCLSKDLKEVKGLTCWILREEHWKRKHLRQRSWGRTFLWCFPQGEGGKQQELSREAMLSEIRRASWVYGCYSEWTGRWLGVLSWMKKCMF